MKVIISAGGTGGHIYPALEIGRYILEQNKENSVLYIGANGTLDKKIYGNANVKHKLFASSGLNRKNIMKNFKILSDDYKAYKDILKVVKEFKPDIGISCGGYISAMTMLALKKEKIPFIVQEQNAIPGLTTKLLSRYAVRYAYAFSSANKLLKYPERGVYTGNPVKKQLLETDLQSAKESLALPQDKKVVLIFGGSLGAKKINDTMLELMSKLENEKNIIFVIATGKTYYENYKKYINKFDNIIIKEYIDDMPLWLNACDLAVTRAGAMTVSELCALRKPSILIPSPNVTADHQTKNALELVRRGGAVLLKEDSLNAESLFEAITKNAYDHSRLSYMKQALSPLSITDGAKRVYDILLEVTK